MRDVAENQRGCLRTPEVANGVCNRAVLWFLLILQRETERNCGSNQNGECELQAELSNKIQGE